MYTKDEIKILQRISDKAVIEEQNAESLGWKILYTQLRKSIEDIVRHSGNSNPPPEPKRKKLLQ